jgi:hypothetical protein
VVVNWVWSDLVWQLVEGGEGGRCWGEVWGGAGVAAPAADGRHVSHVSASAVPPVGPPRPCAQARFIQGHDLVRKAQGTHSSTLHVACTAYRSRLSLALN